MAFSWNLVGTVLIGVAFSVFALTRDSVRWGLILPYSPFWLVLATVLSQHIYSHLGSGHYANSQFAFTCVYFSIIAGTLSSLCMASIGGYIDAFLCLALVVVPAVRVLQVENISNGPARSLRQPISDDPSVPLLPSASRHSESQKRLGLFVANFVATAACILILMGILSSTSLNLLFRINRYNPAEMQSVVLDGQTLQVHMHCRGEGQPTIILSSGMAVPSALSWKDMFGSLANTTKTCWVDRPGYGFSQSARLPQTSRKYADILEQLFVRSSPNESFVLVAHSYGGYDVRLLADRYESRVKAMVLIEASTDDFPSAMDKIQHGAASREMGEMRDFSRAFELLSLLAPVGLDRLFKGVYEDSHIRTKLEDRFVGTIFNNRFHRACANELSHFLGQSLEQVRRSRLGRPYHFPVLVVTGGLEIANGCPESHKQACTQEQVRAAAHRLTQAKLVDLGQPDHPFTQQIVVKDSNHFVIFNSPGLLVSKITEIVQYLRK
ncbi:Alpha/Beta hydrolase protein [Polychytrium aggregatum]|uniref:Alpha/Beta hydrolase protein n=1 Tax=Polychytrium aggregatum TaxID=110093 RepID=UPI0022FF3FF1|nr:Alpha/Beta hydrolase protein [Polychytrium aggregatum]KAI9206871.1 Alpha/Beta hydrolase protein [Polychytrium aggregatum]